jgi:ABC-type sugar transport system permease subunit
MAVFLPFGIGSTFGALGIGMVEWNYGRAVGFAGLDNYADVLTDPLFQHSLGVTFRLFVTFIAIAIPIAMFLAVSLQGMQSRWDRMVQLVFFLPITMSLVSVAMIFALLYDDQLGAFSSLFRSMGLEAPGFLTDPDVAPYSIIALRVWRVVGFYAIILYGGLKAIPSDLYEAAQLDGAGRWQCFRYVTLPMLRPVTAFVVVMATIAAWELFAEPDILTNGGPARSTYTSIMYVYTSAFEAFRLGHGAAAATVLAALIIGSTLLIMRLFRSRHFDT